jgi:hypothetical protein
LSLSTEQQQHIVRHYSAIICIHISDIIQLPELKVSAKIAIGLRSSVWNAYLVFSRDFGECGMHGLKHC